MTKLGKSAKLGHMSTQSNERIPEWTVGDRLRKARSLTGLNTRDFAERIGVSQPTVTNAENDNNKNGVRKITLNAWALATGVPVKWLETGEGSSDNGPGGGAQLTRPYVAPITLRVAA